MEDMVKLAELGKETLMIKMSSVYSSLVDVLSDIRSFEDHSNNLFFCLRKLPEAIQSYRKIRSEFEGYGMDVSSYDDHLASLNSMNATPLTQEGIIDCLPQELHEAYKTHCDYFERQAEEWDNEPSV